MIPTVEQVREHAERYSRRLLSDVEKAGLWRCTGGPDGTPAFVHLTTDGGEVCAWDEHYEEWEPLAAGAASLEWTPCDQAGNPLPLVEELQNVKERWAEARSSAEDVARLALERDAELGTVEQERDAWQHRVVQAEARLSVVLKLSNCTLEQACTALEMAAERSS